MANKDPYVGNDPMNFGRTITPQESTTSPNVMDIASLMDADPYANQQVETTWFDNIGLSNKADDRQAELNQLSAEYRAGIAEKAYDNWYNSPAQSAMRLRQAGINPDLAGLDNAGTSQASNPQHAGSANLNGDNPGLMNFAKGVLGVVSLASNLTQTFLQTQKMAIENDILGADLVTKGHAFGKAWIMDNWNPGFSTDTSYYSKHLAGGRKRLASAIYSGMDSMFQEVGPNKFVSPEVRKHYYQNRFGASDSSFKTASLEGSKYYAGDFETMKTLAGVLTNARLDADKARQKYDKDYFSTASGVTKGQYENTYFQNQQSEQQFQYDFNKTRRDMVRKLQKLSDKGNISATIALLFMNTAIPAAGKIIPGMAIGRAL